MKIYVFRLNFCRNAHAFRMLEHNKMMEKKLDLLIDRRHFHSDNNNRWRRSERDQLAFAELKKKI